MSLSVERSNALRRAMNPIARLVSVIVPVYNASATIERTLRSVMMQTYAHLEIIVVDDGSNDNTAAIIERIGGGDQQFTLLRRTKKGGGRAANQATAQAQGASIPPTSAVAISHQPEQEN